MHIYVALLRGINVGGKNIIKMDALRDAFVSMGFTQVKTYIQSGNVLFVSPDTNRARIEKIIEHALSARFKYRARVLVREKKEMKKLVAGFPVIFNSPLWKHNVIFLSDKIDSRDMLKKISIKKDIEQVVCKAGVLLWSARLNSLTRSAMLKLASVPEYKEMTVRNTNTTKKILELMEEMCVKK